MNPYTDKDELLRDLAFERGFLNGFKSGSSLAAQCESEERNEGVSEREHNKRQKTIAFISDKINLIIAHHAEQIRELKQLAIDFPETPKDMGGE